MVVLVIIRIQVPTTSVDQAGMLGKKLVAMPGAGNTDGSWDTSSRGNFYVNGKVRPFFKYANYTEKNDRDEYDIGFDWHGPQFYAPSQCIKTLDWNKPRRSSPLIAIIGS